MKNLKSQTRPADPWSKAFNSEISPLSNSKWKMLILALIRLGFMLFGIAAMPRWTV